VRAVHERAAPRAPWIDVRPAEREPPPPGSEGRLSALARVHSGTICVVASALLSVCGIALTVSYLATYS
jgi:hypothetical protein